MTLSGPVDLAYVRIASAKPEASAQFLSEIIGLQPVAGRNGDRVFRSDGRYHTVAVENGGGVGSVGIELADASSYEAAAQRLADKGPAPREASREECERRFVQRALLAQDASGNAIDLVLRPARSGRRYFGTRDAGILGLNNIGLRSTNITADLAFWTDGIGAHVADRVGEITYLRFDHAHHRIALYPSDRNGVLYVTFAVESLDCIMQNSYHLQERQVRVLHGPGREAASGQTFLRFADADGQVYAYGCDMATLDLSRHRPRQFGHERYTLCAWGSEARDIPELATAIA